MFLGTPHFAAPEVIVQDPEWPVDGRVDIFAVGVMTYLMITGVLPFQGCSKLDVLYKTVHERPLPPRQRALGLIYLAESAFFSPALTTTQQDQHKVAQLAVAEIIKIIDSGWHRQDLAKPNCIVLPPTLVVRHSSKHLT